VEGLFTPGRDFLVARTGREMEAALAAILADPELARSLSEHGRSTVLARHTCAHRATELLAICGELGLSGRTDRLTPPQPETPPGTRSAPRAKSSGSAPILP
jgi:hypothetical protein